MELTVLGNTVKRRTRIILAAVLAVSAVALLSVRSAEEKVTADAVSPAERFTIDRRA